MPTEQDLLSIISLQTEIARLGPKLGEVMDLVVERTLGLVRADGAAIELLEEGDMVYRAVSGSAHGHLGLRLRADTSLSGLCVKTGEVLRCDDAETDPRVDRAACQAVGLRSMLVMPLLHQGTTVGVLKAMAGAPGHFSEADMALLKLLSDLVAAAMYHAHPDTQGDLYYRATHDHLTGLANRALFMDQLRSSLAQRRPPGQGVGLLMIDLDNLKQMNDHHGHRAGDALLQEFASRSRTCARASDTVARLGGDEFAVLLNPVEAPAGVEAAVSRLQAALQSPFLFDEQHHPLSASIGTAHSPTDSQEIEALLDLADRRMYAIKRARKAETA